jgi:hypothetical protein
MDTQIQQAYGYCQTPVNGGICKGTLSLVPQGDYGRQHCIEIDYCFVDFVQLQRQILSLNMSIYCYTLLLVEK